MNQNSLIEIIDDQTKRALWEVKNVIDCIPDEHWNRSYCQMPMCKHVYHMLMSLDLWFINPRDKEYQAPSFHVKDLNNLDVVSNINLSREVINEYYYKIEKKIKKYMKELSDSSLLDKPNDCDYTKFTLILAQHRHLHSHMGMIMGFIISDTGMWPRVVGLEHPIPEGEYSKYFE